MDVVPPRLTYYDARGTALKCRLLLADLEIRYEWAPLASAEQVAAAKVGAPSCTLPVWEDSAARVAGGMVILEYLGASLGRYSTSLQVQAAARALVLFCEDLLAAAWKEPKAVAEALAAGAEMTRSECIAAYRQNRILPGLTVLTRDVLNLRSLAFEPLDSDYAVLEVLYYADAECPELVDQFPPLRELFDGYRARPGITKLLASLV
ncbi:Glutathione S-transferase-like protein [Giardia duodenalis]|uniref:Glutathione S-transferase-like protein n=1 Tax=Giardia intestinalis (strain ATCC 50803 / WB clone C6) TaxID=184922 RepID=A0A644F8G9_GIAIC|nr:Glutathione S-transferase-like protein [Giardia intestinalis]KAE8304971.1 Glutathione S-transferase-like protein [Giardia intestinalis]